MNVVLFGKRGSGKTYYCQRVVKRSALPVVVIDTLDEYGRLAVLMDITSDIRFNMFKVRFVPKTEEEFNSCMESIARLQYPSGTNVIISEVDMWSNPNYLPEPLWNNLKFSRHYKLNIYCDVRNPSEVNKKITALANRFIIFKITEPLYLDYFRRFGNELPRQIESLDFNNHEYLEYNL